MPPTDPGLDERVCRKLGWRPSTKWWISQDGGETCALSWADKGFARRWLACKHAEGMYVAYSVCRHDLWPPVSTSWEWAGKALEELSKRFFVEVTSWNQGGFGFWTVEIDSRELAGEKTGPLAIARAIDAALPESKP